MNLKKSYPKSLNGMKKIISKNKSMRFAIDFVGTNIGSGTKSYSLNFCNELHNFKIKDKIVLFVTKDYYKQLDFKKNNPNIRYIIKPNFFQILFLD